MQRTALTAIIIAGVGIPLIAGTAIASAKDSRDRGAAASAKAGFEIEIDPELDARFGPRPVNAVQAAAIIGQQFPGARVLEAELDERGAGPIWEMKFSLRGGEREVDVDAVTGAVLGGGDRGDDSDDRNRDDD